MNEIPLPLVHIGLSSLKLLPSDQFRVLEMIKMLAQLPRHANAIIEAAGVSKLSKRGRSESDDESHALADKDKKKKDKRDKKKRREKDKSREKEKSG